MPATFHTVPAPQNIFVSSYYDNQQTSFYRPSVVDVRIDTNNELDTQEKLRDLDRLTFSGNRNISLKLTGPVRDDLVELFESKQWLKRLSHFELDVTHLTKKGFTSLHRVLKQIPNDRFDDAHNFNFKITNANNKTRNLSQKLEQHFHAKRSINSQNYALLEKGLGVLALALMTLVFGVGIGGFFGFVFGLTFAALTVKFGQNLYATYNEQSETRATLKSIERDIPSILPNVNPAPSAFRAQPRVFVEVLPGYSASRFNVPSQTASYTAYNSGDYYPGQAAHGMFCQASTTTHTASPKPAFDSSTEQFNRSPTSSL